MAKYAYPAILTLEDNGIHSVRFPDIKNCFTDGENLVEALEMAQDVLCLMLYDKEEKSEAIPIPTDSRSFTLSQKEIVSLVSCDTLEYRKKYNNTAIKKTLTIPTWLNTIAEKQGVNFSQLLQDALKEKLNVV